MCATDDCISAARVCALVTHTRAYTQIHVYTHIHVYTYIHTETYTHLQMRTPTHTYIHATYTRLYTHIALHYSVLYYTTLHFTALPITTGTVIVALSSLSPHCALTRHAAAALPLTRCIVAACPSVAVTVLTRPQLSGQIHSYYKHLQTSGG